MKYLWLFILAISHLTFAKPQDCQSLAADYNHMQQAKNDGLYRFAKEAHPASQFDYTSNQPFDDYLKFSRQHILSRGNHSSIRCNLTEKHENTAQRTKGRVVDLIAPKELKSKTSDKVILMVHGLTDSPFSFYDLANAYHQQGYSVRTILLPGHGTAPGDLMEVSYQDWQAATEYAIKTTLADYEEVYLAGYSTGGALILDNLMQKPTVSEKIKGILMWAPALKAHSDLAWLAGWVDYIPGLDWLDKSSDVDFAKYESFNYHSAGQVYEIMEQTYQAVNDPSAQLHPLPMLIVLPEHDQTVSTQATLGFLNTWQTRSNNTLEFIYYGNPNSVPQTLKANSQMHFPQCKNNTCDASPIMAHIALTHSPSNPHYGANPAYRNCEHYLSEPSKYHQCKSRPDVLSGEKTKQQLAKGITKRLTYNPYFKEMVAKTVQFIERN